MTPTRVSACNRRLITEVCVLYLVQAQDGRFCEDSLVYILMLVSTWKRMKEHNTYRKNAAMAAAENALEVTKS